jgi:hypothetical protein
MYPLAVEHLACPAGKIEELCRIGHFDFLLVGPGRYWQRAGGLLSASAVPPDDREGFVQRTCLAKPQQQRISALPRGRVAVAPHDAMARRRN